MSISGPTPSSLVEKAKTILEFDLPSFVAGDEYRGSRDDLASFILAVREAGGNVYMASHDTARISFLPKVEATKKPQPNPILTKEVN